MLRLLRALALPCALALAAPLAAARQDGAHDTAFNPLNDGTFGAGYGNQGVYAAARQADGRVLIGGFFGSWNGESRSRYARIHANGALDRGYVPVNVGNWSVYAVQALPDGKALLAGDFATIGGQPRGRVARLDADGTLDATFLSSTGASGTVHAMVVQPDGRILIGGEFVTYGGTSRARVARLNADGSLDATFDPGLGADAAVRALALQPDGRVVVAGDFVNFHGSPHVRVVRLHASGALDATFDAGAGPDAPVRALGLRADGSVVLGGDFQNVANVPRGRVASLSTSGALDPVFAAGAGADGVVHAIAVEPDGDAILGGAFTSWDGIACGEVARIRADGARDVAFDAQPDAAGGGVRALVLEPDGSILVLGDYQLFAGLGRQGAMRLFADGSADVSFNRVTGANHNVLDVLPLPDGRALLVGWFTEYNAVPRRGLARILPDGNLDASFAIGAGPDLPITEAVALPDGRFVVAGGFHTFDGVAREGLVRLEPDGSVDATFDPGIGPNDVIQDVVRQPDGRLLVCGAFTSYQGVARARVARLHADGTLDASFDPGAGANGFVNTVELQADGRILIGGQFTSYAGTPRVRLARLHADGSLDATFDPGLGASNAVTQFVPLADGRTIVCGAFNSFSGVARRYLARIDANGAFDATFDAAPDNFGRIEVVTLQPDGKLVLAGSFSTIQGVLSKGVARLDANGVRDPSFDPAPGNAQGQLIWSIALRPDGKLLLGGPFTRYGNVWRNGVALIECYTPDESFCAGDGSATACPCGNSGAAGRGCASSVDASGASLALEGGASIAADTVVLRGSGMPNSSALYFQGTTAHNGGLGAAFGDGLRCAGGSVVRLGTKSNSAGASRYPAAGDPPVSVRGGIAAPGTRTYQVWYRNAASFCTPSTFNLSNGLLAEWSV